MSWAKIYPIIGIVCFIYIPVLSQETKVRSASYYFQKGEESLQKKSYKTALAHFNECLRLSPYYMNAYYSRALTKEGLGNKQGALNDYNIYLDAKPEDKEALFSRAVGRYDYGQWAVAKEDFQKLLAMPGGETNTVYFQSGADGTGVTRAFTAQENLTSTFLNYLGLIETKLKNFKVAQQHFDSAIHISPTNPDLYLNRGLAKLIAGDSLNAKADFMQTLALNPESSVAKYNLSILSTEKGNTYESEKLLTESIESNPNLPYSYAERAAVRMNDGNWKGALTDYTEAIKLDPKEADYWLNRGIIREQQNDLNGALSDYKQVLTLNPDYEKGWLNHGNAMVKLNRVNDAIEDYTVAITHYPEYGLAYFNRSVAYNRLGKKVEACKDLTQAIALGIKVEPSMHLKICTDK